jgi:predicted CoA-binding protein
VNEPEKIRSILQTARTIAVVGCSPNPARPSHGVARYLIEEGFEIVPVNPGHRTILGKACFPSLSEIPPEIRIDLIDVFRNSSQIAPLVEPAIASGALFFWMQEGVVDPESARRLENAGIGVAMDRCILKDHVRMRR